MVSVSRKLYFTITHIQPHSHNKKTYAVKENFVAMAKFWENLANVTISPVSISLVVLEQLTFWSGRSSCVDYSLYQWSQPQRGSTVKLDNAYSIACHNSVLGEFKTLRLSLKEILWLKGYYDYERWKDHFTKYFLILETLGNLWSLLNFSYSHCLKVKYWKKIL